MASRETTEYPQREFNDPLTGRMWTQLTAGDEFCYPIYYYDPTVTADGAVLVFYRYRSGEVQNWTLEIATGKATRLTTATTPNCLWRFWDEPAPASGVRDLMSAFSPGSDEMTYFDDNVLRAVHVRTMEDRAVFSVPQDRVPCGIPGLSPGGRYFVFTHADRTWWNDVTQHGAPLRHEARGTCLELVDMQTGGSRPLVIMNAWLT